MTLFYGSLDLLSISNSLEDKVHKKSQSACFCGGIMIRTQQRLSPEQSETQIHSVRKRKPLG